MRLLQNLDIPHVGIFQDEVTYVKFLWDGDDLHYIPEQHASRGNWVKACRTSAWVLRRTSNIRFRRMRVEFDLRAHRITVYLGRDDYPFVPDKGSRVHYIGEEEKRRACRDWALVTKTAGVYLNAVYPPRKNGVRR